MERIELERPEQVSQDTRAKLDKWLAESEKILAEEEIVLNGLKIAVERNSITEEEAEEYYGAYLDALYRPTE